MLRSMSRPILELRLTVIVPLCPRSARGVPEISTRRVANYATVSAFYLSNFAPDPTTVGRGYVGVFQQLLETQFARD